MINVKNENMKECNDINDSYKPDWYEVKMRYVKSNDKISRLYILWKK